MSNAIPELIKIGSIQTNLTQDIETSIQEPVVADESTLRFSLHKRGFIHSNSKLVLCLKDNGESDHFLPLNVGIGSLIKNVAFRIGDTTIQEIQDWGELHAYRSLFVSSEVQKEKEQFLSQRCISLGVNYETAPEIDSKIHQVGEGETIKLVRSVFGGLRLGGGTGGTFTTPFPGRTLEDDSYYMKSYQDLSNEPTYQISLQDLIPFFKLNQLPAWTITSDIYIDITLQDAIYRTCTLEDGQADSTFEVKKDETKLIIDHIFYPGDVMDAWANANKKVQFSYFDYRLSKMSLTTNELTTGVVRNLGGAGRIVTKVIAGLFDENQNDTKRSLTLLNKYGSVCALRTKGAGAGTNQGRVTSNLKFNDHFLYPVDRVLSSVHFYDLTQSEGVPPFVTRDYYSGESRTTSATQFNFRSQIDFLRGQFFFQAWRLNRNECISSRGIELYQTYNIITALADGTSTYTLKCWLEVLKYAELEDGKMTCYFA